jgi:hypothetical protein
MRVVKTAMKSSIEKDTSTDKMKTSDDSSGNLASARKPITALSKKKINKSGCHEFSQGLDGYGK